MQSRNLHFPKYGEDIKHESLARPHGEYKQELEDLGWHSDLNNDRIVSKKYF